MYNGTDFVGQGLQPRSLRFNAQMTMNSLKTFGNWLQTGSRIAEIS